MKEFLGGKKRQPRRDAEKGIPVLPGFAITTEVCAASYDNGEKLPPETRLELCA
jgi:pyruvate, orthophosphate dikinase